MVNATEVKTFKMGNIHTVDDIWFNKWFRLLTATIWALGLIILRMKSKLPVELFIAKKYMNIYDYDIAITILTKQVQS